jgi:hypothetical protein
MGVAVLLANQTLQNNTYAQAAAEQLEFLLDYVPRAWNGAISHRVSEAQLVCRTRFVLRSALKGSTVG